MENASKALIMAAGILIGVMIISIGVYFFSQLSNASGQISKRLSDSQITEFNVQFLKYQSSKDESGHLIANCSAHDIISICNLARQNNYNYYSNQFENIGDAKNELYYITVIAGGESNFELKENSYEDFIKRNDIEYLTDEEGKPIPKKVMFKCKVDTNSKTGRVNKITFSK